MSLIIKRGPNHIYAMRRNRGMLQKQLAVLVGKAERCISHYESGTALPPFVTAVMLEIALGVKLSELYPDLYRQCQEFVISRVEGLPESVRRSLLSRLLEKDSHEHTGTG